MTLVPDEIANEVQVIFLCATMNSRTSDEGLPVANSFLLPFPLQLPISLVRNDRK